MLMTILGLLLALFGLNIIIFVHELGHFLLARANGIRVEKFALGFGKAIFSFTHKGTVYQIGMIPFGGYCKMAGEEIKDGVTGAPDEYFSKSPLRRLSVIFAGPFFNYVFGVLIFTVFMLFPRTEQTFPSRVEVSKKVTMVQSEKDGGRLRPRTVTNTFDAPAYVAGIKTGDTITRIGDKKIGTWNDLVDGIMGDFDSEKEIEVVRDSNSLVFKVQPLMDRDSGMSYIGVMPYADPVIKGITPGSLAEKSGLRTNDIVLSVNNFKISTAHEIEKLLRDTKYNVMLFGVKRGRVFVQRQMMLDNRNGFQETGLIFMPEVISIKHKGRDPFMATYLGIKKANEVIVQNIQGLKLLIKGKLNAQKSVGGPVKIFYYMSEVTTKGGLLAFISFVALISVLLGFFNLLPVPPLDGSHMLIALVELITRRKLSVRIMEGVQTAGVFILLGLMILVTFNDIIWFIFK